ncbi:MAG: hypothetical protein LBE76_02935 [Nitrososphaerota archaeon]|jgi:transposase|nr:hypothetical protein [Nitrososphaerota archaeon]
MSNSEYALNEEASNSAITCKKCDSKNLVKSGLVAGKQRFRCKECGCNFRVGDNRTGEQVLAKKLLCVLLHFMTKTSFRTLGELIKTDHALAYRWVREFNENSLKIQNPNEIKQMNPSELQHFIDLKKNLWSSEPLTVVDGELCNGCSATVILQFSKDSPSKDI